MPRIRTIKPEFWADEKLSLVDATTRLVFLGLISMADDAGRLIDNVKLLDGMLFPSTDDTCRDALDTLARLSRVIRYRSGSGQALIQIANWERHQKVDKPSRYVLPGLETAVVIQPLPAEANAAETPSRDSRETLAESSRDSRETLAESSRSDLGPRTMDHGPRTVDPEPSSPDVTQNDTRIVTRNVLGTLRGTIQDHTIPDLTNNKDQQPSASVDAAKQGRATWLTPFLDAWRERFGGSLAKGKVTTLSGLVAKHGADEVLRRWMIYLAASPDGRYASPAKFLETYGQWDQPVPQNGTARRLVSKQEEGRANLAAAMARRASDGADHGE